MTGDNTSKVLFRLFILTLLVVQFFIGTVERDIAITKKFNNEDISLASEILSGPILFLVIGIYLILVFNMESFRPRVFYELLYVNMGVALISFLKIIFAQPRPHMHDETINAYECELDYGMPSGHAFTVVMISMLIYKRVREITNEK